MYTIVRALLVLAFTAWGVSIANIIACVMQALNDASCKKSIYAAFVAAVIGIILLLLCDAIVAILYR